MGTLIILSIVIGTLFIVASLNIALVNSNLNPTAIWIIRVLVALGVGFVAAGILGNVEVGGPVLGLTLKAGGPIAITVIIYLFNPIGQMIARKK
jgi:hypothetical protein